MRDGNRYPSNGDGGYVYCNGGRDNEESRVAHNHRVELIQKSDSDDERSGNSSGGGENMNRDRIVNNRSIPDFVVRDDKAYEGSKCSSLTVSLRLCNYDP